MEKNVLGKNFDKKRSKVRFFEEEQIYSFSPSLHWEYYLSLERDMLDFLRVVPLYPIRKENEFISKFNDANLAVSSPKLLDVFMRTCFILEASFKAISVHREAISYLERLEFDWARHLSCGQNRFGEKRNLSVLDFLTFYEQYCILKELEVRIRYFRNVSDLWVNMMGTFNPFKDICVVDTSGMVEKTMSWWEKYNNLKHNFYNSMFEIDLETTLNALAGLFCFTAVVPQMRNLLCDHGFIRLIQNGQGQDTNLDFRSIGMRNGEEFIQDPWVNHRKIVVKEYVKKDSIIGVSLVSDLFVFDFHIDYLKYFPWSGLKI